MFKLSIEITTSGGAQPEPGPADPLPEQPPGAWTGMVWRPYSAVLYAVRLDSPAYLAGMMAGDTVLTVDGYQFKPDATGIDEVWNQCAALTDPGETVIVTVKKISGQIVTYTLTRPAGV